jgi:Leu/Phe-tRNA-protein transferase
LGIAVKRRKRAPMLDTSTTWRKITSCRVRNRPADRTVALSGPGTPMHHAKLSAHDPQRLTASLLLRAYRQGWFPMANPLTGRIEWFNPDPRAIIPLDEFHIPRNLAREVRQGRFDIRCDSDFASVIRACSAPRRDDDLSWA